MLRTSGLQSFTGGGAYIDGAANPQSFSGQSKHQIGDVGFFASNLNLGGGGQGRQDICTISTGTEIVTGAVASAWGTSIWRIQSGTQHLLKASAVAEIKVLGNVTLAGKVTASSWNPNSAGLGVYSAQTGAGSVAIGAQPAAAAAIDATAGGGQLGVYAPPNLCGIFLEA